MMKNVRVRHYICIKHKPRDYMQSHFIKALNDFSFSDSQLFRETDFISDVNAFCTHVGGRQYIAL